MHVIFNHAIRWKWHDRNPISMVRQSAKREKIRVVLNIEQIKSLLKHLKNPGKMVVLLDVLTGLCVSELLALPSIPNWRRHCSCDAGRRSMQRMTIGSSQSGQERKLPYWSFFSFRTYIKTGTHEGRDYGQDWLAWVPALVCNDPQSHDEDIKTVQELMRHADSSVTLNLYSQTITQTKRDAQSKVARLVFQTHEGRPKIEFSCRTVSDGGRFLGFAVGC